jgi:hypothetical protein
MNEMEMLTQLRGEVPLAPPTPGAERLFRAGLADIQGGSRARGRWPGRSWLPRSRGARLATAVVLAGAVAAGVLVAVLPGEAGSTAPAPAISAQLLADRAAGAALAGPSGPSVPAGQWVYRKIESENNFGPQPRRQTEDDWLTADGVHIYDLVGGHAIEGIDRSTEMPSYSQLSSLSKDPVALDDYLAHLAYPNQNATAIDKEVSAFSGIVRLLTTEVLPPSLVAELYHALADIPTVTVREHVTDITGRTGIAFFLPQTPNEYPHTAGLPSDEQSSNGAAGSDNWELILSTTDYHVLAQADWSSGGTPANPTAVPGSFSERAYISEAFVSGPGVLPDRAR